MNKKEIIKILDIASFAALAIATILVVIFQFTGEYMVMKFSIVLYAVCFLILSVMLGFKVYSLFQNNTKEASTEENQDENKPTKKQKALAILCFVLAILAFAFTCVLLALY